MSYGFSLYNDADELIIDGEYKNYEVHQSGTTSVSSLGGNYQEPLHTISLAAPSAEVPLIFVKMGAVKATGIARISKSGGLVTSVGFFSAAGSGLDYFLAGPVIEDGSGGYGLLVYNDGGDVVFDSRNNYLHFAERGMVSSGFAEGSSGVSATATDYVMLNSLYGARYLRAVTGGASSQDFYFMRSAHIASSAVQLSQLIIWGRGLPLTIGRDVSSYPSLTAIATSLGP